MRTFEVLLILLNVLALLLSLKRQSKVVWLAAAGVNLTALGVHGLFEGVRYQMVFSYAFVILFGVYALAKTNDRFLQAKMPRVLKGIAIGVCLLFLGVTAFLAYSLPVFTLPKPTGGYDIGIQYLHLIDENRTDPFLDKETRSRELMVKVYYPAKPDDSKPFARYFNNSTELVRLLTTGYRMPEFLFDHLTLVQTNSKQGLQISDAQPSYPVVLFSHGAGTTMEVQTAQSEDLASHGYIVAAIDHTYASVGTIFPNRVVSAQEATTNFNTAEPAEIITQIMADDATFVIETLGEMNADIDSPFRGKFNLDQIGAIGHSVGGAVAYNLAINESRVKAAIDLDGIVFITPQEDSDMAAFLMLANDKFHVQMIQERKNLMPKLEDVPVQDQEILLSMYGSAEAYNEAYNKAQQNVLGLVRVLAASGNLFTIQGSDHMKFVDIGLFIGMSPLRELIGIGGNTDPTKCLEITQALTLAFFNQHLRGTQQIGSNHWRTSIPNWNKLS